MTDNNLDEESLRRLQVRTGALPRDIAPPDGAWRAIQSVIDAHAEPTAFDSVTNIISIGRRPLVLRPVVLAAAALILVASSSAVTAIMLNRRAATGGGQTDAPRSVIAVPASGSALAALAEFTAVENDFIATASRLSAVLESGEAQLAPETLAKLRESLSVIDAAILEARQALAADPANRQLIEMLSTSYSQKVDLLRRTTEMGRS